MWPLSPGRLSETKHSSVRGICAASALHIRYNLPGVVNRCLIGDCSDEARDISILTFPLVEARRYEHDGCANGIHCR